MEDPKPIDSVMEDEDEEEADSDFDVGDEKDDVLSSATDEDEEAHKTAETSRPSKRRKVTRTPQTNEGLGELDSGDEATIREREKAKRKQKRKGQLSEGDSEGEEQGWRAKTRAMREREKDEKKKNKLASTKGSTLDVDKLWEEMNKSGGPDLPPPSAVNELHGDNKGENFTQAISGAKAASAGVSTVVPRDTTENLKENASSQGLSDTMITIKRTYEFAGEVHTEVKKVLKSSAEARLWLSQRSSRDNHETSAISRPLRRPLRKISRFDPNLSNLESIKKSWEKHYNADGTVKGPKLNTVEKSKMDWAAHVDQEGLKEELDKHAKAKEGYHGRKDFLGQVEQRREEEARTARLRG